MHVVTAAGGVGVGRVRSKGPVQRRVAGDAALARLLGDRIGSTEVGWTLSDLAGWGPIFLAATQKGVCRLELLGRGGEARHGLTRLRAAHPLLRAREDRSLRLLTDVLEGHLADPQRRLNLPLDLFGTPFQHDAWEALRGIPCGTTVTYGALAQQLGRPRAARAVGQAVGANPVAIAVPCHRVTAGNGTLGGYLWGTEMKERLLAAEAAA